MIPSERRNRRAATKGQEADGGSDLWLWCLLAVGCLSLLFQLFPQFSGTVIAAFDIRQWTWRSFAIASAAACIALVILRMRLQQ
jgi:hypothetical protein